MTKLYPTTLLDFQRLFPDEAACVSYLERLRWPQGFVCPVCGAAGEPYRFEDLRRVRCRACGSTVHVTAGTVMHRSHTPLQVWFWAAYLVTSQTPGMSARQFGRQLGISRYETAFQILHKLRAAMVNPDREPIGGPWPVEVDETGIGGVTKGQGRGVTHQITVAGAVEVRVNMETDPTPSRRADKRLPEKGKRWAGRVRLRVVPGRYAEDLCAFVQESVVPGSIVRTDGYQGYDGLTALGFRHYAVTMDSEPEKLDRWLPMIHLVFSNLKTWLMGTHHGVSPQHLQAYLNEFVFRFNRRKTPMAVFQSLLGLAGQHRPTTYKILYATEQTG
jgi:transposase-like protein